MAVATGITIRDIDPSKWIASHDEGPINLNQDPQAVAEALSQLVFTTTFR